MKFLKLYLFAGLSASAFLFTTTGCDNTSDGHMQEHDEHTHEELSEATNHSHSHNDGHSIKASDNEVPTNVRKVTIEATDFAFDPAIVTAQPGEKLYIELINEGETVHMWQLEGLPKTHVHAAVGETTRRVVEVPEEQGSYKVICTTPGHEERGMVGTLKVSEVTDS